jgi:hypothetical protein
VEHSVYTSASTYALCTGYSISLAKPYLGRYFIILYFPIFVTFIFFLEPKGRGVGEGSCVVVFYCFNTLWFILSPLISHPLVTFKLICYVELVIGRSNALVYNEGTTLQLTSLWSVFRGQLCFELKDLLISFFATPRQAWLRLSPSSLPTAQPEKACRLPPSQLTCRPPSPSLQRHSTESLKQILQKWNEGGYGYRSTGQYTNGPKFNGLQVNCSIHQLKLVDV